MVILFAVLVCAASPILATAGDDSAVEKINMYIGTSYWKNVSDNHDYGNNMLNIGLPFSHSPWTAQTQNNEDKCRSPYYYFDEKWQGMRRSHWMSGSCVIDYGSATVTPSLTLDLNAALNYHTLNHSNEFVRPYQYNVFLPESGFTVEVTSKNAAGIMRTSISSPDDSAEYFYMLFMASDSMYNQSTVTIPEGGADDIVLLSSPVHRWYQSVGQPAGFSGHHYFKASRMPVEVGVLDGYASSSEQYIHRNARVGKSSQNGPAVAYMKFDVSGGPVSIATGCSFISTDKAEDNMKAELADNGNDCEALFDLEQHSAEVKAVWEEKLSPISVAQSKRSANTASTAAETFKNNSIIFYTALWHALLLPRIASDADGEYLSFTDTPRTVKNTRSDNGNIAFTEYYDDFSMWDIFRAQVPLLHLLLPSVTVRDMVASLTVKAQQGHWLPIFPAWNSYTGEMVGDHCGVWVTDAVLKGLVSADDPIIMSSSSSSDNADVSSQEGVLFYILKNALMVPFSEYEYRQSRGRRSLDTYLQYGFIPLEDLILSSPHPRQQVSRTLEYAYDDHVLLQLLIHVRTHFHDQLMRVNWLSLVKETGSKVIQVLSGLSESSTTEEVVDAIIAHLTTTRLYYRNVVDSEGVGFVRGKHSNGTWAESDSTFDPSIYYSWLTETNVWQYTWFIPHSVEDMIQLYGGNDAFLAKLDMFFDDGWYNHGNEPDHHAAYLSAYAQGGAWQVQKRVHDIISSQYTASEQGLPGNEDAGQMSAWMVMSAMGIYQVCPGCGGSGGGSRSSAGEYVLSTPLFDSLTIQMPRRDSPPSSSNKLHIMVRGRLDENKDIYIQKLLVNNIPYECAFATHEMIAAGGVWEFHVGSAPNKTWGNAGHECIQ